MMNRWTNHSDPRRGIELQPIPTRPVTTPRRPSRTPPSSWLAEPEDVTLSQHMEVPAEHWLPLGAEDEVGTGAAVVGVA